MVTTDGRDGENCAAAAACSAVNAREGRNEPGGGGDDAYWRELVWRDATAAGAKAAVAAARQAVSELYAAESQEAPRYSVGIRFTIIPPRETSEG